MRADNRCIPDDVLTLGNAIRFLRTNKNMSSRTLSVLSGLSPSYVGKVEAGALHPSFDAFCAIAKALDISDKELSFLVRLNQRKLNRVEDQRQHLANLDGLPTSG